MLCKPGISSPPWGCWIIKRMASAVNLKESSDTAPPLARLSDGRLSKAGTSKISPINLWLMPNQCPDMCRAVTWAHKDPFPSLSLQNHCCGVLGPSDWQEYTSAFRHMHSDADYPWPRMCCVLNAQGLPINLDGCKLGVPGYYNSNVRSYLFFSDIIC